MDERSPPEPSPEGRSVSGDGPTTLRAPLGRLAASITWEGPRRTLEVHGIRSERTVRALSRAVARWQAFGRYDRVLLDLTGMPRTPELAAELAADARQARAMGRRLDFLALPTATPRRPGE